MEVQDNNTIHKTKSEESQNFPFVVTMTTNCPSTFLILAFGTFLCEWGSSKTCTSQMERLGYPSIFLILLLCPVWTFNKIPLVCQERIDNGRNHSRATGKLAIRVLSRKSMLRNNMAQPSQGDRVRQDG